MSELKNRLILSMTHCGVIVTKLVSRNEYGGGELKQESVKFNNREEMTAFVKEQLQRDDVKSITCQTVETTTHSWSRDVV